MFTLFRSVVVVAVLLGGFVQAGSHGGEKKDKDKKAEDVVVNDELTNADLKDKKKTDCFCKTYTFKMVEGKTYQLDMVSKQLDSWLRLEDPRGNQVAEDDDSGGMLNARIIYRAAKTGDHTIVCTTCFPDTKGRFTLTVKQLDR